jgi:hypothetical protein
MYSSVMIGGPILIFFHLRPKSDASDAEKERVKAAKAKTGGAVV